MSAGNTKDSKFVSMSFNTSEIRASVGDYQRLTTAELRMLIKHPKIADVQRVELYYSTGSSFSYHALRFVTNEWKDKWLTFDVTDPLRNWLKGTGELARLCFLIEVQLLCVCGVQPW